MVCLQVKLCDPHLSALEVRFSRRGAIQIYLYIYRYRHVEVPVLALDLEGVHDVKLHHPSSSVATSNQ